MKKNKELEKYIGKRLNNKLIFDFDEDFKPNISFKGKILLVGINKGFIKELISNKDISSITIIDNDIIGVKTLTDLLGPLSGQKINYVFGDIYNFIERDFLDRFDCICFFNYENPFDGAIEYLKAISKFNTLEYKMEYKIDFLYEEAMLSNTKQIFMHYINFKLKSKNENNSIEEYMKRELCKTDESLDFAKVIINKLDGNSYDIRSIKDFKRLTSSITLKGLSSK